MSNASSPTSTDVDSPATTNSHASLESMAGHARSYNDFIRNLEYVDVDDPSFNPEATCPICRDPYSEALQAIKYELDLDTLRLFDELPFSKRREESAFDRPVRLPCQAHHIVGSACIRHWAEHTGNTCPLDREVLFQARDSPEEVRESFRSARRRIENLPLRSLLGQNAIDAAEGATEIEIHSFTMSRRLVTLMIRMAVRMQRPKLPNDYVEHIWRSAPSGRRNSDVPRLPRDIWTIGQEVKQYRKLIRQFAEGVDLQDNGRYPDYLIMLLEPAVGDMFCLLYRMARALQGQRIASRSEATSRFFGRVAYWWLRNDISHTGVSLRSISASEGSADRNVPTPSPSSASAQEDFAEPGIATPLSESSASDSEVDVPTPTSSTMAAAEPFGEPEVADHSTSAGGPSGSDASNEDDTASLGLNSTSNLSAELNVVTSLMPVIQYSPSTSIPAPLALAELNPISDLRTRRLWIYLDITVEAWVSQELLMTQLRAETEDFDESDWSFRISEEDVDTGYGTGNSNSSVPTPTSAIPSVMSVDWSDVGEAEEENSNGSPDRPSEDVHDGSESENSGPFRMSPA